LQHRGIGEEGERLVELVFVQRFRPEEIEIERLTVAEMEDNRRAAVENKRQTGSG